MWVVSPSPPPPPPVPMLEAQDGSVGFPKVESRVSAVGTCQRTCTHVRCMCLCMTACAHVTDVQPSATYLPAVNLLFPAPRGIRLNLSSCNAHFAKAMSTPFSDVYPTSLLSPTTPPPHEVQILYARSPQPSPRAAVQTIASRTSPHTDARRRTENQLSPSRGSSPNSCSSMARAPAEERLDFSRFSFSLCSR